jgi:hypothetical protein
MEDRDTFPIRLNDRVSVGDVTQNGQPIDVVFNEVAVALVSDLVANYGHPFDAQVGAQFFDDPGRL